MADYDWFKPSAEEMRKEREHNEFMEQNRVSEFTTSTAVGTKFYACQDCGTMMRPVDSYASMHAKFCPVKIPQVNGKHKK